MNVRQLSRSLKTSPPACIYLVAGEEEALINQAMELLKDSVRSTTQGSDFVFSRLEAKSTSAQELDMAARSVSLFGGKRLVVVQNAQSLRAEVQNKLGTYLERPVSATTLVFEARGIGVDTRDPKRSSATKTLKALKKLIEQGDGVFVDCPKPRPRELPGIVQQMLADRGLRADREALYALVDTVGEDLGGLIQAIEKLSLYLDDQTTFTKQVVDQLIPHTRSQSIFALTDAVGERSADKALGVLADMLRDNESALMILGQIARHWRTLARVQALYMRGESQESIRRALGLHPFVVKKSLQQSKKFTPQALASRLILLSKADSDLKRSRMPERLILERLILSLCSDMQQYKRKVF